MPSPPDALAVTNARLRPGGAPTEAVVIVGGRISHIGSTAGARELVGRNGRSLDADGDLVVPGLIDAHCHIAASAAELLSIDCRSATSLAEALARIRTAAATAPRGWLRATGFDEALVAERRAPTPFELDEASGRRPVVLHHRARPSIVMSDTALRCLGAFADSDSNGFLIAPPTPPPLDADDLARAAARVANEWLSYGVTRLCDAGATNNKSTHHLLTSWRDSGVVRQHVSMLGRVGLLAVDLQADSPVQIIGTKFILEENAKLMGVLDAVIDELRSGRSARVAVHVVEIGALALLLDALEALVTHGTNVSRCRLEHVSLCPPEWIPRLHRLGVTVVTQPHFLTERREKYAREIPANQHTWLYPVAQLVAGGVVTAGSSDSPVGSRNPFAALRSILAAANAEVSRAWLLDLYTVNAARALADSMPGDLRVGAPADLAVLDGDPTDVPLESLDRIRARATFIGGELVYSA